ncbi:MAG: hypothetical protein OHK0041_15200 [Anaerolineales bacterium]
MEGLNLAPILIPLLALIAGWAIGFFDSNLRTSKKIKQAEDSARAAIQAAEKRLAEEREKITAAPADPSLLRLKNENGALTLELDGARVDASTITPPQRKRLIGLLNAIRPWLEGKPAATPAPPPPPAPVSIPITSSPPAPVTPPPSPAPVSKPAPGKKAAEPAPASIVEQVNAILQTRIAGTPLASPGIILMESVTGGVLVYVGVNKYEGVDAVPDEAVKAAIRAAIAEWEQKYTPGL